MKDPRVFPNKQPFTAKKYLTTQLQEQMESMLEKTTAKELFEMLFEKVQANEKQDLIKEIAWHLSYEGYILIKSDTQKELTQIQEALCNIIPDYNSQQTKIFA